MKRVLIVEDNEGFSRFLKAFISYLEEDIIVDISESAEYALEYLFEQGKYDLVLTDIALIFMNGLEFCLEIRKQDKEVKVFGMSGYGKIVKDQDLAIAGFDKWFYKPESLKDLMVELKKVLIDS